MGWQSGVFLVNKEEKETEKKAWLELFFDIFGFSAAPICLIIRTLAFMRDMEDSGILSCHKKC